MTMQQLETDVLVVGGGLAGLRAAIAAAEGGASVLLVSKTQVAVDNCTAAIWGAASGAVGNTTEEEYLARLTEKAAGRGDPVLREVLAEESGSTIRELQRFGVRYEEHHGQILVDRSGVLPGLELTRPMAAFAKAAGVTVRWPVAIGDLTVKDLVCSGATGLDLSTGEEVSVEAKATVLCCGGHAAIFPFHDNPGRTMGDCAAMALRAGASLVDMDAVTFHSLGMIHGGEPYDALHCAPLLGAGQLRDEAGSVLRRSELPEVWARHAETPPEDRPRFHLDLDLSEVDFDDPSVAKAREITFGASCPTSVHVAPLAHYCCGGIAIDADGVTGVEFLLAAGECTGGVFGAGRPGGAALTDCLVFGRRAGGKAARLAMERGGGQPGAVQRQTQATSSSGDESPAELLSQARRALWNGASVVRTPESLLETQEELARIAEALDEGGWRSPSDWLTRRELRNVTAVGRALVGHAAIAREEGY